MKYDFDVAGQLMRTIRSRESFSENRCHRKLDYISVISSIWTMEEDLTPRGVLLKSVSRSFDFSPIFGSSIDAEDPLNQG